ncbi:MAG TPA: type II toxin-antitoxin system RelE/ParE family toxin [bacterium]|nr:type II toxin-antitoxin system RelE/ParE family toxin [bacterium]HPG36543.1 type II toxin-antitoxin system RelE/ParE family toxin [bacterium]HRQ68671.1 type II toxin-antitoxin system RelE/ParE family toxin [bacterium]
MYREIELMENDNGKCEALEFIENLNEKTQLKVEYVFKLVEDLPIVPAEYLKKLSGQIYEIRVQVGSNAYRFLSFFHKGDLIVVTHGFQKKSQKTPPNEIARAEKLRGRYLTKHGG